MKILVPFRAESFPEAIVPEADSLAASMGAEVVLVALAPLPETSDQRQEIDRSLGLEARRASRWFRSPVRERVEASGDPVRGILHAAEEEQPDLIAVPAEEAGEQPGEPSILEELRKDGRFPVRVVGQVHH